MKADRIVARYRIETPGSIEAAAEMIAGEQSSGTFLPVPGETEQLKARFRARVTAVERQETVEAPSLPGAAISPGAAAQRFHRAEITIEFPLDNIGLNLPTLAATVCGNLFELREHSGCKLLDLELPEAFARRYPGPQFGVAGTRRLTGVHQRPLIGTIIKPSVGLTPEQTASLVRELVGAGIDFIKDDELMADPPYSPLERRVEAVMAEVNRLADRNGTKAMVAFNVTDEIDAMKRHHDVVLKAGGTCVMVSLLSAGLAAVSALRAHAQLPIHGHRNGWGMLSRHPMLGVEFAACQKLWRAAGVDHLHVNGLQNKFWEPDASVVASIRALQQPLWGGYQAMPVVSSGQWGGQAQDTYRQTGTVDLLYVAGGGIMAHPSGPAAGVRAIQQAWAAAVGGIELEDYARTHEELRQALEKFGRRRGTPGTSQNS